MQVSLLTKHNPNKLYCARVEINGITGTVCGLNSKKKLILIKAKGVEHVVTFEDFEANAVDILKDGLCYKMRGSK